MTIQLIIALLSLLAAVAGIVRWWLKSRRGDEELRRERALNAEIIKHQADVRLSIVDAEKRAEEGRHVAERALAGELSRDDANRVRSGLKPNG